MQIIIEASHSAAGSIVIGIRIDEFHETDVYFW